MKILITGGAGFIGSSLVRGLLVAFPEADITLAKRDFGYEPISLLSGLRIKKYAHEHRYCYRNISA